MEDWAEFFTQQTFEVNGFHAWHYLINTSIGQFHIVEWERVDHLLERVIFDNNNDKAERKFKAICKKMVEERC